MGKVLKVDNATLTKSRMMYARVLVDMTVADGFSEELFFSNEHEQLISQCVQYDWIPTWCNKCAQFGHVVENCRVAVKAAKLQVDENEFRPLRKAFRTRGVNQGGKEMVDIAPRTEPQLNSDKQQQVPNAQKAKVTSSQPPDPPRPNTDSAPKEPEGTVTVPASESGPMEDSLVGDPSLSPRFSHSTMVRQSSLSLHNGFNALSVEHTTSVGDFIKN